jgi:hypothetical protein
VQDKHKDEFAKLRDLGRDEQRSKREELSRTVSDETLAAVGEVLKPEQVQRLKQIDLQQAGARGFTRPEVQKALTLTDDQKEKIKTLSDDAAKEIANLFPGGAGGRGNPENREKIAALRKETLEKIQAVLTDGQKKTWKDLTGEPFEVVRRRPDNNQ